MLGGADAGRALCVGLLVAARVGPLAVIAPWLGLRGTPAVVRLAVTGALAVALTPLALASASPDVVPAAGVLLGLMAAREAAIGATFALATALPLLALGWAGRLADVWRGAGLAEVLAPGDGERTSPLGLLLLLLGVALFAAMGGHRLALAAFATGLRVAPVGAVALGGDLGAVALGVARLSASALGFALAVAAPAAVVLVALEAALGVVARAAPQVPVFFVGMPLRAAAGLAALLIALSFVVARLPGALRDAVDAALSLVRALG